MKLVDFYHSKYIDFQKGDKPGIVYVLRQEITMRYKIGITTGFKQRQKTIVNISGLYVDVVLAILLYPEIDNCMYSIERCLFKYFNEKRKFGEWFALSLRDIAEIKELFWNIEGDGIIDNKNQGFIINY